MLSPGKSAAATTQPPVPQKGPQPTRMSDNSPAQIVVAHDLHARILEAQRMTQQAILESFSLSLRSMGGAPVAPGANGHCGDDADQSRQRSAR